MTPKKHQHDTAPLLCLSGRVRGQIVRRTCESLEAEYGTPRHGNPTDPLDDLIYIILSNRTGSASAQRVFEKLYDQYRPWYRMLSEPSRRVERFIRPAGLSRVKSHQIRGALRQIANDFGDQELQPLRDMAATDAHTYLTSLPGVSDKVAKCVMLYTLGASVLPVDAHVHRIASRLGWTARKRADQCHEELESIIPPHRRYAFHVDCVAHGRVCCRSVNPDCGKCCVNAYCEFYRRL